jgi:hypothetical protein
MGMMAAQIVLKHISRPESDDNKASRKAGSEMVVAPELVVRGTTCAFKAAKRSPAKAHASAETAAVL